MCIHIGLPFTTRLAKEGGMVCPNDITAYDYYVCKACIVHSVLESKLTRHPANTILHMLECAWFVDRW